MVNGFEYSWEDIQVVMLGKELIGITSVEYSSKKEHTNIYGKGAKPIAMGRGKEEHDAKITVLQSEMEALQSSLSKGSKLTDISPFDVTVSYAPEGGKIVTDVIKYCRISEVRKGISQGDGNMTIDLPLVVGDVDYNI